MQPPTNHIRPDGLIRPHSWMISMVQRAVDCLLIAATLFIISQTYESRWNDKLMIAAALAAILFQLATPLTGLYRSWRADRVGDEIVAVLGTWLVTVPGLLLAAFFSKTTDHFSRLVISGWMIGVPAILALLRVNVRLVLRFFRARGHNIRRVVIAGATDAGVNLSSTIRTMTGTGNRVVGFYDDRGSDRLSEGALEGHTLLGNLQRLVADARAGNVDVVYIALPLRAERRIKELISLLADTTATVYVVTDLFMFDLMNARWGSVGDMPVVSVFDTPFHGLGGWVKRLEDIILASAILTLVSIPMFVIAMGVKLTSKGPIFFRQTRYGLGGRPIRVLKFRSMTTMDDGPTVVQATKGDARITPFGAFLRKTSLDELPQFWNVLKGDMSVVGPRPHAVAHNEMYRGKIRGYMLRHKVKPGITGWAQVNGWRGETAAVEKMERRIEHDLYYIDNWSLFWDLKIVFLTVFGQKVRNHAL